MSSSAHTDRWAADRYRRTLLLADALAAFVAPSLAIVLRFSGEVPRWSSILPAALPLLWTSLLGLHRAYEPRYVGSGTEEVSRVLRSGLWLFTCLAVVSYLFNGGIARSVVVFAVPVTVACALLTRRLLRRGLERARAAGRGLARTLVIGAHDSAVQLVDLLRRTPERGMAPVGICLSTDDVLAAVDLTGAHVVAVVSDPQLWGHPLRRLAWALEERDVELLLSPGILEVAEPRLSVRPVAGLSLLHLERPSAGATTLKVKAALDRLLGTAILVALSPLLLAIAALVRLDSPGPALFRQLRVGIDGRQFQIYKFRSMVQDAEHRLIDLVHHDEGNGTLFKIRLDPRLTGIGARLRRFSLDELPQLINVVKGEMSLVGPRPPLPAEVATYSDDATRRLRMRPGMTGLWQVSGRSDLDWEQSLLLDLRYVDNWTMRLDLSILWRTVRAVLKGAGAY